MRDNEPVHGAAQLLEELHGNHARLRALWAAGTVPDLALLIPIHARNGELNELLSHAAVTDPGLGDADKFRRCAENERAYAQKLTARARLLEAGVSSDG